MTVLKFGGTSVGSAEAIKRTAEITASKDGKCIVVVSALSGVTDSLVQMCNAMDVGDFSKARSVLAEIISRHISLTEELGVSEQANSRIEKITDMYYEYIEAVEILGEISLRTKDIFLSAGEMLSSTIIAEYYKSQGIAAKWADTGKMIKTDSTFSKARVNYRETGNK